MSSNPPVNTTRITPYLLHEDVSRAIDWLTDAFGFREHLRVPGPDGKTGHAEMRLSDGVIMMGCPVPDPQEMAVSA
jgi:PhnB protein